ncbi:hypothetical protein CRUP_015567 [Coryphaenoides rupestris]|nr:hypothetical protein CRUP_015567 [Coryphaenoides rupestris]
METGQTVAKVTTRRIGIARIESVDLASQPENGLHEAFLTRPQVNCSQVLSPGETQASQAPGSPDLPWLLCAEAWLLPVAKRPCVAYSFSMDGGDADFVKSSVSPEAYRRYNSSQWSYRQGYGGWAADSLGSQYHNYSEYGSNESKDILDISNYTPQKAKWQPFPESLSESSSDSSHLSSAATGSGPSSGGGSFKQKDSAPICAEGGQSSLSSLEKLMMDWHESAAGPSYNWSQNVLFQSAGSGKQGRGRRKRAEPQPEKERAAALPPDSPTIPSPTPVPKRGAVGGRPRGTRGGRGGLSPCQRERPSGGAKGRGKSASALGAGGAGGAGVECSDLFQEGPDYYSGDSSSLSPLATPNPAAPAPYLQDPSEYPSPYSAHPSTPSSEERYPAIYPGESSSSLSPGISSPPYPPKPTPPPAQTFHPGPSRTFSPSCSPAPRGTPHGSTALSPPHRAPPKDPQYAQYDSPSYCSSPFWYGQSSHSGSPSPQTHPGGLSGATSHAHSNSHMSPHGHAQGNPLASPHANTLTQLNPSGHSHNAHHHNTTHPNSNLSPHAGAQQQLHAGSHLHTNPHGGHPASHNHNQPQPHPHHSNPHLHSAQHTPHSSPGLHPHPAAMGFEERTPPPLDSSPHQEDLVGGYALPHHPYQGVGQRYVAQAGRGAGGGCCASCLSPPPTTASASPACSSSSSSSSSSSR